MLYIVRIYNISDHKYTHQCFDYLEIFFKICEEKKRGRKKLLKKKQEKKTLKHKTLIFV